LLSPTTALLTVQARIRKPFNANTISDLYGRVGGILAYGNNFPYAFVSANKRHLGINWPVVFAGV